MNLNLNTKGIENIRSITQENTNKQTVAELTIPGEIIEESKFEKFKKEGKDPSSLQLPSPNFEEDQNIIKGKSKTTIGIGQKMHISQKE